MKKDKLLGLYLLWIFIIFIEWFWFLSLTSSPHTTTVLAFVITTIGATLFIGAVGLLIFRSSK